VAVILFQVVSADYQSPVDEAAKIARQAVENYIANGMLLLA
jgi:hypothetical protein